jgi:hypothetical protein
MSTEMDENIDEIELLTFPRFRVDQLDIVMAVAVLNLREFDQEFREQEYYAPACVIAAARRQPEEKGDYVDEDGGSYRPFKVPNKQFNPTSREDARRGLTAGWGCRSMKQELRRRDLPVCGELSVMRPQAADTTRGSEIAIYSRRGRSCCDRSSRSE